MSAHNLVRRRAVIVDCRFAAEAATQIGAELADQPGTSKHSRSTRSGSAGLRFTTSLSAGTAIGGRSRYATSNRPPL